MKRPITPEHIDVIMQGLPMIFARAGVVANRSRTQELSEKILGLLDGVPYADAVSAMGLTLVSIFDPDTLDRAHEAKENVL